MGKKYIIELEEEPFVRKSALHGETAVWRASGFNSLVFDQIGIDKLTPYTKPDTEAIREEAYQHGLNDAWEAARKIIDMPEADLLNLFTECYAAVCTSVQVFLKYDASEAIEKIRQYEQEKEEQIQVGDEVIRHYKNEFMEGDDAPSIFLSEEDGHFRCLAFNGRSIMIAEYPKNQYRKTGRHFSEIAEVLQKMQES